MSECMLEVENLSKTFQTEWGGVVPFIHELSLSVAHGEVFALLGPNGSGKTTVTKTILGLMRKRGGMVRIGRREVSIAATRAEVAYMPETPQFPLHETADSFLKFLSGLHALSSEEQSSRIDSVLSLVGLSTKRNKKIKTYSKGMVKRLALAQALLHKPRIIFFDEPLDGLDPCGVEMFFSCLEHLKQEGVTVILTTHVVHMLDRIVDRVGFMCNGALMRIMSTPEVEASGGFDRVYKDLYRDKEC